VKSNVIHYYGAHLGAKAGMDEKIMLEMVEPRMAAIKREIERLSVSFSLNKRAGC